MDVKDAGTSLDSLISSFNTHIAELQQLVIARNMYQASSISDLSEIDAALKGMELQVRNIKNRLREDTRAIPKAKFGKARGGERSCTLSIENMTRNLLLGGEAFPLFVEAAALHENPSFRHLDEKKSQVSPQMWYVTGDEMNSIPSYVKQRLTLYKVNAAISDMATYAEANAKLIAAPRKKLSENEFDKALLLEIALTDAFKGKHFFLKQISEGLT